MTTTHEQLLTVGQVSELFQISRQGVYKMCYEHRLPCTRIGTRLRFSRKAIEAYMESRTTGAARVRNIIKESQEGQNE